VCELHVEIFSKLKKYGQYTPINYDGVEIELPEDIFLVKNLDNNEYGTLTCRDEPNETIQDCSFENWKPTEFIFNPDPNLAIENCNFTLKTPSLPRQLHDTSILVMDKRFKLSYKEGEAIKEIVNVSPMIIKFAQTLTILLEGNKAKLQFKGGILKEGIEIIESIYNATHIAVMHTKALENFSYYDWKEIFRYFTLGLQIVGIPVALTTLTASLYMIITSIIYRRKRNKKHRKEKKYALRRNFEVNKIHAKRTSK
jgi:hypothetical protein